MSLKYDETSTLIESYVHCLNENVPINISFITRPLTLAITDRIRSLEHIYGKIGIYRFLTKKGVYPFLLFSTLTGSIGYGLHRAYTRSTKLVLNLLGVLYPTYCCWRLVKDRLGDRQEEQLKAWLTYWMIFGSFQVLDHWMASDLFMFSKKKYNLYKLLVLYWAQSPHSKGALLLFRHVIQKPSNQISGEKEASTTAIVKEGDNFSYLNGYMPPDLLANNKPSSVSSSSSSSSEFSVDSHRYHEEQQSSILSSNHAMATTVEKELFSSSLMNTAEAAW